MLSRFRGTQCSFRISPLQKCLKTSLSICAKYSTPTNETITSTALSPAPIPVPTPDWAAHFKIREVDQSSHDPRVWKDTNGTETSSDKPPASLSSESLSHWIPSVCERRALLLRKNERRSVRQRKSAVSRSRRRRVPGKGRLAQSEPKPKSCSRRRGSGTYLNWANLGSWATPRLNAYRGREQAKIDRSMNDPDMDWSTRFLRLGKGPPFGKWRTMNVRQLVQKHVRLDITEREFNHLWYHLRIHQRLSRWQEVMLWCLQNDPMKALNILRVASIGPTFRPPRYMAQDCLHFLARYFLFTYQERPNPAALSTLWLTTMEFVDCDPAEDRRLFPVAQDVIQMLLRHCADAETLSLYHKLCANHAKLHFNTLLHFLQRFVDMGKLELCMELLKKLTRNAGVKLLSSDQVLSGCVKLLRTNWGIGGTFRVQSIILSQMLEMGVRPDTHMYNIIMLNMIEGGDFSAAWQTYDLLQESGHSNDRVTYHILAKGAGLSRNAKVLQMVLEENPNTEDLYLISEILGAISELSPGDEFSAMFEYYEKHLDLRPLQELGICSAEVVSSQDPELHGRWPSEYILGRMIIACNKCQPSASELIQRYEIFSDRVRRGHPLITPVTRYVSVANSFIFAFGQSRTTLEYCTTVLKDMLSPPPSTDSTLHAPPTVQTWNILMLSYQRHKQKHAAAKVLSMMRMRGLKPDVVTWTTLIHGLAAMQDIEGTIGALRQMEREGFRPNAWTINALDRYRDRKKLLDMLKLSMDTNEDEAEDPKEYALLNEVKYSLAGYPGDHVDV